MPYVSTVTFLPSNVLGV